MAARNVLFKFLGKHPVMIHDNEKLRLMASANNTMQCWPFRMINPRWESHRRRLCQLWCMIVGAPLEKRSKLDPSSVCLCTQSSHRSSNAPMCRVGGLQAVARDAGMVTRAQ
jgi:hypothetical protein